MFHNIFQIDSNYNLFCAGRYNSYSSVTEHNTKLLKIPIVDSYKKIPLHHQRSCNSMQSRPVPIQNNKWTYKKSNYRQRTYMVVNSVPTKKKKETWKSWNNKERGQNRKYLQNLVAKELTGAECRIYDKIRLFLRVDTRTHQKHEIKFRWIHLLWMQSIYIYIYLYIGNIEVCPSAILYFQIVNNKSLY